MHDDRIGIVARVIEVRLERAAGMKPNRSPRSPSSTPELFTLKAALLPVAFTMVVPVALVVCPAQHDIAISPGTRRSRCDDHCRTRTRSREATEPQNVAPGERVLWLSLVLLLGARAVLLIFPAMRSPESVFHADATQERIALTSVELLIFRRSLRWTSRSASQQDHELDSGVDVELLVSVQDVRLDRTGSDAEALGDVTGGEAVGDGTHDLHLASSQDSPCVAGAFAVRLGAPGGRSSHCCARGKPMLSLGVGRTRC